MTGLLRQHPAGLALGARQKPVNERSSRTALLRTLERRRDELLHPIKGFAPSNNCPAQSATVMVIILTCPSTGKES